MMVEAPQPSMVIVEAIVVIVVMTIVLRRMYSWKASSLIAVIKVALPVCYFLFFFQPQWTFEDDLHYLEQGSRLIEVGEQPVAIWLSAEGRLELERASNSLHSLYYWWNFAAQYYFGKGYYAPVLLNIAVTAIAARLLYQLALTMGASRRYSKWLALALLFHPELLAWSTVTNLKDTLVLALDIAALYYGFLLVERPSRRLWPGLAFVAILLTLSNIRFYVIVLILSSGVLWLMSRRLRWRTIGLLTAGTVAGILVLENYWPMVQHFDRVFGLFGNIPRAPLGAIRFLLTPQPWSVSSNYTFLILPAMVRWTLFVPALIGGVVLWRRNPNTRLVLLFLILSVSLYSIAPDIQGPRQRYQLLFVWSWMELHGLLSILRLAQPVRERGVSKQQYRGSLCAD